MAAAAELHSLQSVTRKVFSTITKCEHLNSCIPVHMLSSGTFFVSCCSLLVRQAPTGGGNFPPSLPPTGQPMSCSGGEALCSCSYEYKLLTRLQYCYRCQLVRRAFLGSRSQVDAQDPRTNHEHTCTQVSDQAGLRNRPIFYGRHARPPAPFYPPAPLSPPLLNRAALSLGRNSSSAPP